MPRSDIRIAYDALWTLLDMDWVSRHRAFAVIERRRPAVARLIQQRISPDLLLSGLWTGLTIDFIHVIPLPDLPDRERFVRPRRG